MRKLVLWGHDLADYVEMFDLPKDVWQTRILEFGCGPSAVNARLTARGGQVVSCDPFFCLDQATLTSKIELIFAEMVQEVYQSQDLFDFSLDGGLPDLIKRRRAGMAAFFQDFVAGQKAGRYLGMQSLTMPFKDFEFDYALCSHYLFAGLDNQDVNFHLQALQELARVAREVRVFPLIDRHGAVSEFLGPVLLGLQQAGYGVEVREVPYHFQQSGNAMLRVWAQTCALSPG